MTKHEPRTRRDKTRSIRGGGAQTWREGLKTGVVDSVLQGTGVLRHVIHLSLGETEIGQRDGRLTDDANGSF